MLLALWRCYCYAVKFITHIPITFRSGSCEFWTDYFYSTWNVKVNDSRTGAFKVGLRIDSEIIQNFRIFEKFLRIAPLYAFWRKCSRKWSFGDLIIHATTFDHFRSLWRHFKKNKEIIKLRNLLNYSGGILKILKNRL